MSTPASGSGGSPSVPPDPLTNAPVHPGFCRYEKPRRLMARMSTGGKGDSLARFKYRPDHSDNDDEEDDEEKEIDKDGAGSEKSDDQGTSSEESSKEAEGEGDLEKAESGDSDGPPAMASDFPLKTHAQPERARPQTARKSTGGKYGPILFPENHLNGSEDDMDNDGASLEQSDHGDGSKDEMDEDCAYQVSSNDGDGSEDEMDKDGAHLEVSEDEDTSSTSSEESSKDMTTDEDLESADSGGLSNERGSDFSGPDGSLAPTLSPLLNAPGDPGKPIPKKFKLQTARKSTGGRVYRPPLPQHNLDDSNDNHQEETDQDGAHLPESDDEDIGSDSSEDPSSPIPKKFKRQTARKSTGGEVYCPPLPQHNSDDSNDNSQEEMDQDGAHLQESDEDIHSTSSENQREELNEDEGDMATAESGVACDDVMVQEVSSSCIVEPILIDLTMDDDDEGDYDDHQMDNNGDDHVSSTT